jgi:hypothetical protein
MVGEGGGKPGGPHPRLIYIRERLQEIQQEAERLRAERAAMRRTPEHLKARDKA